MIHPKVSIIITVFRRDQYLRAAIESALEQTFSDNEILVTDDSNQASIREICDSFHCPDRLRYRGNARQLGAPLNVRAALHEAKGKYISILNDDDYWSPTFLEKLVAPLEENPDRVIAFSDHWIVHEDGEVDELATDANTLLYGRKTQTKGEIQDPRGFVLKENGLPLAMASIFRKDALDLTLLTKEVVGAYDFWISCILAASGKKFYYVPERLTYYRFHSQSETARKSGDKSQPMIFIFQELLRQNWFPEMKGLIQSRLSGAYFRNGKDSLSYGKTSEARSLFLKAVKTKLYYKPIIGICLTLLPNNIRRRIGLGHHNR